MAERYYDSKTLPLRRGNWSEWAIMEGEEGEDRSVKNLFMVQWGDEYYLYFVDTEKEALALWHEATLDSLGNKAHYSPLEYATMSKSFLEGNTLAITQQGAAFKELFSMLTQPSGESAIIDKK